MTGSTCSSTSSGCRTSTCRSPAADARPLAKALRQRPKLDITSQWANFVRNHDELTLDKLSDTERQEVFDAFGPDQTCNCTAADCAVGCLRCSAATNGE